MTHPNQIFHYTSVETLALILSSQKIRFTRLDKVDDALEGPIIKGVHFNKYFFVSCWTTQRTESIPQWHLYTEKMTGVRIELTSLPFQNKKLTPLDGWANIEHAGNMYAPLNFNEMFGQTYMILPMFMNHEQFAGCVEYVSNIEERYSQAVQINKEKGQLTINRPFDLARLKSKHWEFQSEYRFSLFVLPSLPLPPEGPGSPSFYNSLPNHMMRAFIEGADPGVEFIDLDLNQDALNSMVITTGPLCSAGLKLSVEALVCKYAPRAVIRSSALEGAIRQR